MRTQICNSFSPSIISHGRFVIDFLATVPFVYLLVVLSDPGFGGSASSKWLVVLSLVRLLRLARLVSVSKVCSNSSNHCNLISIRPSLCISYLLHMRGCVQRLQIVYLNVIPSKGDRQGKGGFQFSVTTTYIILLAYMLCVCINLEASLCGSPRNPWFLASKSI